MNFNLPKQYENGIESIASIGFKPSRIFVKTSLVLTHRDILIRKGQIVELNGIPQVPNLVPFLGLLILLPWAG